MEEDGGMRRSLIGVALALCLAWQAGARAEESLTESLVKATQPVLDYALNLIGSPYKFGGSDPDKGVDCSGYVKHVYKQSAGIDLPHNAKAISERGEVVATEELKPGDLVFFNTMRRAFSHVGIYTGDDKFVHAASSRSGTVTVSDMKDKYWSKRFDGARRIANPK
jgi:cell wall-associated NlpC family hydrolase